jgi:4'-phosphopantetheinyl transferase
LFENERLEFNLSHSGDRILIGASSCGPLGVDVERLSRKVEFESLSDRYFSPEEADAIRLHPEKGRRRAFFDTWVCKEAFLKAVGDGLTMPLDSFVVHFEGKRTMVRASKGKENTRLRMPWFLDRFRLAPDYVGAVALPIDSVVVNGFLLH